MLLILLLNLLFAQQELKENTGNSKYFINSKGIIALDSNKGFFRYPKDSEYNFFYSISNLFAGKKSDGEIIYSANFGKYSDSVFVGIANSIDPEKYFIYESQYFDELTGESKIGDYHYPIYQFDNKLPGIYVDDNSMRNVSFYRNPFIQSDNDIFTIYHQKFENGNIEYQIRCLNYIDKDYVLIENKVINNLNENLFDCYFSPLLDPDINTENNEFVDVRNDVGIKFEDKLIFFDNSQNNQIRYYSGFKYIQKAKQINGNYVLRDFEQFQEANFNVFDSEYFYNTSPFYHLFLDTNSSQFNSDIKAMASVGPFSFNVNDTLVFTYVIGFAPPLDEEALNEVSNMLNIHSILDEANEFYYTELFDFALSVPLEFKNSVEIYFNLNNMTFETDKNQLKSGKYLILTKKENKFVLKEKIIID